MKTISDYLEEDYIKWADRPYISAKRWVLCSKDRPLTVEKDAFESRTFREVIDDIRYLSKALLNRGFEHKNIMLCSENSPEWILLYFAIMGYCKIRCPPSLFQPFLYPAPKCSGLKP